MVQAPGGPEEDPSGGFTHGGWSVNYWDEAMGKIMGEATTGVTIDTYKPTGPIRTGSFMLTQPSAAEIERRRKLARES